MHISSLWEPSSRSAQARTQRPRSQSDGIEPVPPPELSVTEAIPPVPELDVDEAAIMPDLEEPPIVIDANVEGGDIDVSVRVLSPERTGRKRLSTAQQPRYQARSSLISPPIRCSPMLCPR